MDFNYHHHSEAYVERMQKTEDKRVIKPQQIQGTNLKTKLQKNTIQGSVITRKENRDGTPGRYDENNLVPGKDIFEVISNVSQQDNLAETIYDNYRCGTGSLLDAYLILGGNFEKLSLKLKINKELTFKNIHLAQDKIYSQAKTHNKEGLESSYTYHYNKFGNVTEAKSSGEIFNAATSMGLKMVPVIGSSIKTINQKKEAVNNFLNNTNGVLQVSVYLDPHTGKVANSLLGMQNHYVAVFKKSNNFYMADTGQINNGNGNNIKQLDENQLNELVYNTPALVSGLTLQ